MTNPKKPRRMARPATDAANVPGDQQQHTYAPEAKKRPSKQDAVLELMRRAAGAALGEIVETTGWLPHTARAALTGLRKKGHAIEKSKFDGETRYSIKAGAAQ